MHRTDIRNTCPSASRVARERERPRGRASEAAKINARCHSKASYSLSTSRCESSNLVTNLSYCVGNLQPPHSPNRRLFDQRHWVNLTMGSPLQRGGRGLGIFWRLFCVLALLAAGPTVSAATDWNGEWEVTWHDGGGQLVLKQQGELVTGTYAPQNGRIEAKIQGPQIEGRWFEGERSGSVLLALSNDRQTFAGRQDALGWWTGKRSPPQSPSPPIDLQTPRSAFVTFIAAANRARGGQPEAWANAMASAEFATSDQPASPAESLLRVRRYFDVIDLTLVHEGAFPADQQGTSVDVQLEQLRSGLTLTVTLRRNATGDWHLVIPSEAAVATARQSLLTVYGASPPTTQSFRRLQNPRDTMRAFLEGMNDWHGEGRALVFSTLDLSALPVFLRQSDGVLIAQYLRRTLQKIGLAGLQTIPSDGSNRDPYVHFVQGFGSIVIAPSGSAPDAPWQFTSETLSQIPELYFATANLPAAKLVPYGEIPASTYFNLRQFFVDKAPFLLGRLRRFEYWQLLMLLVVVPSGVFLGRSLATFVSKLVQVLPGAAPERPRFFIWALTMLFVAAILQFVPSVFGLPERQRALSTPIIGSLVLLSAAAVAWHLLSILGNFLARRAEMTVGESDDILLNFSLTGVRAIIIFSTSLSIAYLWSIPTENILAGLGIGGLAFAIAARDTLANIFGAGILVSDRPFRSGDWINAGFVEGSVEAVGIRSTRIRTAQDSVSIIPNGKLADSTINNLGTRRHRVIKLNILVTEGASPQKLQAYIEALGDHVANDPVFVAKLTEISVADISWNGVTVAFKSYLNVSTDGDESMARHALLVYLMELAQVHRLRLGNGMAKLGENS